MTRSEHLQFAKARAIEYVNAGDNSGAFTSFISDLGKHADTADAQRVVSELGGMLLLTGNLSRPDQMRDFIEGTN